ncbi:MAG: sensor histidine kinase [Balneolaceae bacterium]
MELRAGTSWKSNEKVKNKTCLQLFNNCRLESDRLFVARQFKSESEKSKNEIGTHLELLNNRIKANWTGVYISFEVDCLIAEAGKNLQSFTVDAYEEIKLFSGQRIVQDDKIIQPIKYYKYVIGYIYTRLSFENDDDMLLGLIEAYSDLILKELELAVNKEALVKYSDKFIRQKNSSESTEKHSNIVMKMAAHDMTSPLNAIHGYLEMIDYNLKQSEDLETVKKYHRQISSGIHDISAILAQFQDITSIKIPDKSTHNIEINLDWMLLEIAEFFYEKAKSKNLRILRKTPEKPVFVRADLTKLKRSIVNLVTNAIKYSDKTGEVRIELSEADDMAIIKVIDQGIGIRKEKQKEIFKPFFQISEDTHKKDPSSVGLGLYIASNFIKQMGGYMDLESEPNSGSCFYIYLPSVKPTIL